MPAMLSIVATPIGNLGDITLRAIETLKNCDAIVCEDTRVTGMLLKHLSLPKKELLSFHGFSDPKRVDMILARLHEDKHLALVSDAGTPGISDPGYAIISRARAEGIAIEAIPGPSALVGALSVCGLPINRFTYVGFLPLKKGRQTFLKSLAAEEGTIVFYESVHRIDRTLNEVAEALAVQPERAVVVVRELTKLHEQVISATVATLQQVAATIMKKGEFVVIIGPQD